MCSKQKEEYVLVDSIGHTKIQMCAIEPNMSRNVDSGRFTTLKTMLHCKVYLKTNTIAQS